MSSVPQAILELKINRAVKQLSACFMEFKHLPKGSVSRSVLPQKLATESKPT